MFRHNEGMISRPVITQRRATGLAAAIAVRKLRDGIVHLTIYKLDEAQKNGTQLKGAEFWKSFRHAFPEGAVDESIDHVMMYNGSATGRGDSTKNRTVKQHENEVYRKRKPSLFYAVMTEPKCIRTWCHIGVAKGGESRALMHIVEAVAIATTHTYTSGRNTALLKDFGIVEEDSQAFGCKLF